MRGLTLWMTVFVCALAAAANATIAPSAKEVRPLEVGDQAPSASLRDPDGQPVALDSVVGEEPVALIFYRGGW